MNIKIERKKDGLVYDEKYAQRIAGKRPGVSAPKPLRESQIEKRLVQRVKDTGGECRKVRWIGRPGATDRVIMRDGDKEAVDFLKRLGVSHLSDEDVARVARIVVGQYILWPELKAPGKKPEPHQVREHARMRKMGQRVEVVDSYERIEEILK